LSWKLFFQQKQRKAQRMRSNDVTLFSNGIGHFRRYYEVDKNLEISIPFKKGHVGDVASSLQVFGNDSNCIAGKPIAETASMTDLKGLKVGLPKEYFGEGLDKGVEEVVKTAIKKLEEMGAEIVEVELPHTKYAVAVYYIIMASEVSSNLARFDGIRFGGSRDLFGPEPKRRIMLGTFALSTGYFDDYFIQAAKVRTLIKQDFDRAFEKCDVIVGPVSPTVAWNLGEKINDPLKRYLTDTYTIPASLAGLPGLSVPCGFSEGLPVGLQILGKYFESAVPII
jgi:aspartyl-tRNA(Asn)/glutamyl-tRNA(Gln) amidotransferase subunit A